MTIDGRLTATRLLTAAIPYTERSAAPTDSVLASVQNRLGQRVDPAANGFGASRQVVAGSVEARRIYLRLMDTNLVTSRKSWNVAFHGRLEPDGAGSLVHGLIDIPDRRSLDQLIVLVKVACAMAVIIVATLAVKDWINDGTVEVGVVLTAGIGAVAGFAIPDRMRVDGLAAAARDADTLVRFLDDALQAAR